MIKDMSSANMQAYNTTVTSDYLEGDNQSLNEPADGNLCCMPGMERVIVPVIFTIVVILGCVGNSLVIVVVLKNKDYFRNTTNLFILNLSVADLLFLTFCVPFHAVIYTTMDWPFGEFMCKFVHLIQYSSMVTSIFTLVAMSFDRYLAVVYALETKHVRTPCIALVTSVIIWVVSFAIALPWPIFYTVKTYGEDGPQPLNICADDWGSMRDDKPLYFLLLFFLGYLLPLLAIFILSTLMIRQLWILQEPEGPSMRASVSAKKKVTRLIIVVVAVFGICWLPSHIIWIWTNFFRSTFKRTYFFYYLKIVAHALAYGNSSVNPVIYAFLSANFRKGFQQALGCKSKRTSRSSGHQIIFSKGSYVMANNTTVYDSPNGEGADTCL